MLTLCLLDKTGTITLGNRMATDFIPVDGATTEMLADAAQLASLADETPEGRSIVVLAKEKYGLRGREVTEIGAKFIPFSAQTRMSGCDLDGRVIRKGAADAITAHVQERSAEAFRLTSRGSFMGSATPAARRWWSPRETRSSA